MDFSQPDVSGQKRKYVLYGVFFVVAFLIIAIFLISSSREGALTSSPVVKGGLTDEQKLEVAKKMTPASNPLTDEQKLNLIKGL